MPQLLSYLRHVMPSIFDSTAPSDYKAGSYRLGGCGGKSGGSKSSPFPSTRGIQKTVTHTVSYLPNANDSDAVELIDVEKNKQDDQYNQW